MAGRKCNLDGNTGGVIYKVSCLTVEVCFLIACWREKQRKSFITSSLVFRNSFACKEFL